MTKKILGVFLEKRASKKFVGKLYRKDSTYIFEYDKMYAYSITSIPVGPELPITRRIHRSDKLFASFSDRIPSRQNPAYVEYCAKFGISPNEKDDIILLSTIGKRGPSSFVYEMLEDSKYTSADYRKFRDELSFSIRDFAEAFDIGVSSLNKLEKDSEKVKESLKRIEIYDLFPDCALFELNRNGKLLHSSKKDFAENVLKKRAEVLHK
jgi:HipA-like protein